MFEQAPVKVEREKEYGELKSAVERVFSAERIEKYLRRLDKKSVRARDFEKVLNKKVIEAVDEKMSASGQSARQLFDAMGTGDQGLIREFYLSSVDQVSAELRRRYQKLFTYY